MKKVVRSTLRNALSRSTLVTSLAGDGLLVRFRSTSIALLAVVAAVGLGLTGFIAQLGWPTVSSGPIPSGPRLGVVRNDPLVQPRVAPSRAGSPERVLTGALRDSVAAPPNTATATSPQLEDPARSVSTEPQPSHPGAGSPAAPNPPPTLVDLPAKSNPGSPGTQPQGDEPTPSPQAMSDDSPGKSGESHGQGNAYGHGEHGKPDWAGH